MSELFIFGSIITFILMLKFNEKPIYEYLLDLKFNNTNTDDYVAINYTE